MIEIDYINARGRPVNIAAVPRPEAAARLLEQLGRDAELTLVVRGRCAPAHRRPVVVSMQAARARRRA